MPGFHKVNTVLSWFLGDILGLTSMIHIHTILLYCMILLFKESKDSSDKKVVEKLLVSIANNVKT